jgi:streptogramin lyase
VITEFLLPSTSNVVSALTDGPDGNLWFAASTSSSSGASASIGRITPSGTVSQFTLPSTYFGASTLTTGPDGNLWFSNQTSSSGSSSAGTVAIARITPTGTVSEYPLSSSVTATSPLTVGPDGNLWFSEQGRFAVFPNGQQGTFEPFNSGGKIGQITPAGAITEFPLAPGYDVQNTSALTVGPDKDLYFTFSATNSTNIYPPLAGTGTPAAISIGRITTSGSVIEFTGTVPFSSASPSTFTPTVGSDSNLWFPDGSKIGRLDRALVTPDEAIPPGVYPYPNTITKKGSVTAIVLGFDEALDSASASTASFYSVAMAVKKHHMIIYSKFVKIRGATYDPSAGTVTLKPAKPFKDNNGLEVTVRAGIMATNGVSTTGNTTSFPVFD